MSNGMTNHFVRLSIIPILSPIILTSKSDGLHSDHRNGSYGIQFQFPISLQRLIVQARPPWWPAGINSVIQHEVIVVFLAMLFKMWVVTIKVMNWWFKPETTYMYLRSKSATGQYPNIGQGNVHKAPTTLSTVGSADTDLFSCPEVCSNVGHMRLESS
jgi:hypothetical protein